MSEAKSKEELIVRDWLAIERTKLANERTFLAYFRTGIVMLGTGLSILRMDALVQIYDLGVALSLIAPLVLLVGIWRFFQTRHLISRYYR